MKSAYTNGTDAYNSGSGQIDQISPGLGIAVNNDNPKNLIVSADIGAGDGIQVYAEEGSNKIFIKSTVEPGTPLGTMYHGLIKAPDPIDNSKTTLIGLDQLFEVDGNSSVGYAIKIVRCIGSTGTLDIANCRLGYNTDFAPSQGLSFLKGIPLIVINRATGNYIVQDTSGTIMDLPSLTVLPGQTVFLWTNTQTNWGYVVVDYNGIIPTNVQINSYAIIRKGYSNNPTNNTVNLMNRTSGELENQARVAIQEDGAVVIQGSVNKSVSLRIAAGDKLFVTASDMQNLVRHILCTPTTARASANFPHGVGPTVPADGDVWTTTAGMFVRINGVTKSFTLT